MKVARLWETVISWAAVVIRKRRSNHGSQWWGDVVQVARLNFPALSTDNGLVIVQLKGEATAVANPQFRIALPTSGFFN